MDGSQYLSSGGSPLFPVPVPVPKITIRNGKTVVFTGDSITDNANPAGIGWMSRAGGYVDQVNALLGVPINMVNTGIAGNSVAQLADGVPTRISQYNADVIVILIGVNGYGGTGTSAEYDRLLSRVRQAQPTVQIACLSVLIHGEQWSAGPPIAWNNGTNDPDPVNSNIRSLCLKWSCCYIDVRSSLLVYESVNNTPAPGVASGILTSDGVHPNATGQLQMAIPVMAQTTVTP